MPCDSCKKRCDLDCGYVAGYWHDYFSGEDCAACNGFVFGDPEHLAPCGDVGCDICMRVRAVHLNENPFEV